MDRSTECKKNNQKKPEEQDLYKKKSVPVFFFLFFGFGLSNFSPLDPFDDRRVLP